MCHMRRRIHVVEMVCVIRARVSLMHEITRELNKPSCSADTCILLLI